MKYAPAIEKMHKILRRKFAKQLHENDEKLHISLKGFSEKESVLCERLKELEVLNAEMSSIIARDKVKIGEYALKSSLFDKS